MIQAEFDEAKDADDYEQWLYFQELEKQWHGSQVKLTESEWLKIFPGVSENLLASKISEWQNVKEILSDTIRGELQKIKRVVKNDSEYWLLRELLKLDKGQQLLDINRQIARLKASLWIKSGKAIRGRLTEGQIQCALKVPIEQLYEGRLRRSGKNFVGLCPFHQERHGSFYIYTNSNRWQCFGACGTGGNTINYIMRLHGFNFIGAVKFLLGI